jgi:cellulose synthase/poly-beta-1,6-N-acetylglucosamine synthase-like glycosyltransferase
MSSGLLDGMTAFTAETAGLLVLLLGVPVAVVALYQVVLAVTAFFYRGFGARDGSRTPPRTRVAVLVPAHDEAELIARCVRSLRDQTYPSELYEVVVIADNCTDETAAIAEDAGARVLVRNDTSARGKGHALRWALDRVLAQEPPPDAVAVVDADSVAGRDFLEALVAPFERGAAAAQGESLLFDEGSPAAALRAAAFLLVNRVRPSGRSMLGLPTTLAGNGMLFGRELLETHPWDAFSAAEDVEYTIRLRLAGIGPAFAGGAILLSPTAPTSEAATQQQLRWEGGKMHVARTQIPRLVGSAVRLRRPLLLEAAFELAVPPLGLLAALAGVGAVTVGVLALTDVLPGWSVTPWLVALAAIPVYVLVGLRAARAPRSAYRSLAQAPMLVLRKVFGAYRLLTFRADSWVRTERGPGDRE